MIMGRLMNKLLLSCLRATELMEKKLHIKLSFTERLQLKAHKMICKACADYEKQTYLIDSVLSKPPQNGNPSQEEIESLKKVILTKIPKD